MRGLRLENSYVSFWRAITSWRTCSYILIPSPHKLTQNASLKISVAAHIYFNTLLLADKTTHTYKAAVRRDLSLHHSLCPVARVLLLMAKRTGHRYFQLTGDGTTFQQQSLVIPCYSMKTHLFRDRELFTSFSTSPSCTLMHELVPELYMK